MRSRRLTNLSAVKRRPQRYRRMMMTKTQPRLNSTPDLAYYLKLPYATKITVDECGEQPCFMAEHPELYGCMAQGATPDEALRNLRAAREDYIKVLLDMGIDVPQPKGTAPAI